MVIIPQLTKEISKSKPQPKMKNFALWFFVVLSVLIQKLHTLKLYNLEKRNLLFKEVWY